MIEHFKDTRIMNSSSLFTVINDRRDKEEGVGVGVEREVYSLFWKQFANSMTIGERGRVPFIRHDHFIKEWEAVGRILVKGHQSVSYFHLFLCTYQLKPRFPSHPGPMWGNVGFFLWYLKAWLARGGGGFLRICLISILMGVGEQGGDLTCV